MASSVKKKSVRLAAIIGAVSGAILFVTLYSFTGSLFYIIFIPIATAISAWQIYMTEK